VNLARLILAPRSLLAVAVVVITCVVSTTYSIHHHGSNPFETLYMHLMPAPLVHDSGLTHFERGDYLLTVPAPVAALATNAGEVEAARAAGAEVPAAYVALTNLQLFQIAAILLILILFSGIPKYLRTDRGDAPTRLFAGGIIWVRDEMVYPVMGKETGRKFLPYFVIVFAFILFMNLSGLVPGSATATASIFVTGAMALTTLLIMLVGGMVVQGPVKYWLNLVPEVPWALWPILFLVELIGVAVKPFALMIRLFANMTGGHMVVLSFIALIFFLATNTDLFGAAAPTFGWLASPLSVGFAVFVMIIEAFVALLQAYIFTQLSIIFVYASIHPSH